jgi:hypothetical protein
MAEVHKINKNTAAVHVPDVGVYAISINAADSSWSDISDNTVSWEMQPQNIRDKRIVPYGANNNLPVAIRNIMDGNSLAPGILQREIGLLYGNGCQLFEVKFENGQVIREYKYDAKIWDWLNSWDYLRYVQMATTEYKYLQGFFNRTYRNRGVRVGQPAKIARLEVVPAVDARLEWPENDSRRLEDVKHIFTGDFENNCQRGGILTFPVHDRYAPFRYPVSMSYHNTYSFARNFYSLPSYFGTLNWIKRSSDIPDIFKYLTDNGITVAFHVRSPQGYWEQKKMRMEEMYPEESVAQIEKRMEDLKETIFQTMTKVLAGKKNAGKFIETVDFYDGETIQSWKFEPIDQKIKDFIDSQLKIAEKADSATTSGMGLHPSLSNIIVNGQLSSGSQMLYALKLYLASDTTIPEEVIFEAINQAIQANFPGNKLKLGFYHPVVKTEDEVPPEERTKNKI